MTLTTASPAQDPDDDPWMWLEEVQDAKALDWVRERNAQTRQRLQAWLGFDATRERILQVLDSRDRIPVIARRGDFVYNFWQDSDNPRGLWRRTTLDEYRLSAPAWELLLDVDALGRSEGENWVWAGAVCLGPDYTRCLVKLSRGGADAQVVREFDTATRQFVAGGFNLPEAKSEVAWLDRDTVFVGTDFGPGSLTDSGYPRLIKRWQRGQPLADAVTVFEAQHSDVAASVHVDATPGFERTLLQRAPDFFSSEEFLLVDGQLRRLDKPADAQLGFWYGQVLLALRSDWQQGGTTWPRGALLASDAMAFLNGKAQWTALFTPTATRSLAGYALLRHTVLLELLDNVAGRLQEQRFDGSHWNAREVEAPFPGTLHAQSLHDTQVPDDPLGENYLLTYTDFLTPESLLLGRTGSDPHDLLKARPAFFDATGMRVEQRFATSRDGTRVPYFVVWPKGATPDGNNPTLLYGYGGFEVPLQPQYSGGFGNAWYGRGGVQVVANIRGGGEFGPGWHQAALKGQRQKAFDDFIAVAEDLVAAGITRPRRLAIQGGSNGGLLVGAVMLQRPEQFRAVVCQVPLLDMRRYHRLLAGASWMGEYGDPDDPAQWEGISKYSPYQNVPDAKAMPAGTRLPAVLFTTSTRDDRVHPGHARKMTARLREKGHDAWLYENIEGGHGGAADNKQRADLLALEFAFLWQELGE
ncbi:MAG: prolyl oligopeptidase family protein [Proteobacteria bacterium]|jgi:prolyl oligopeptidase|nr:prolyl oligopeptidase family protein [Pseudomonadota bacterium]